MTNVLFPPFDFLAYWSGFHLMLDHGNPYDYRLLVEYQRSLGFVNGPGPIYYSPILFFLLAPILWLPLPVAQCVWALMNLALVLGCVLASARLLGATVKPIEASVIATLFPPCVLTIIFGQVSALVCFSALASIHHLSRSRPLLAGIVLLPALLKPHLIFLLLIPMILNGRKIQFKFVCSAVGGYLFILLSLEAFRPGIIASYLNANADPLQWMGHSPLTLMRLLVGTQYHAIIAVAPAVIAIMIALFYSLRKRIELSRDTPLLLAFSALLTPYIWTFDFVVLIPAVLLIYSASKGGTKLLLGLALAWWSFAIVFEFDWRSCIFSVVIAALTLLTYRTRSKTGSLHKSTLPTPAA